MPFVAGVTGNKFGRPRNSGHRQKLFNDLVLPHKEKLINQAIEMALNGNESMLKIFLIHLLPAKPIDEPVAMKLPDGNFTQITTLLNAGAEIIKALSNNEITPDQGRSLLDVLSEQRKNIEAGSLEERINEIEFLLNLRQKEKHHA
jgi:hypothetical protein